MNKLEQNLDYQYQKTCGISFQVTSLAINHHLIESCVSLSFFFWGKSLNQCFYGLWTSTVLYISTVLLALVSKSPYT